MPPATPSARFSTMRKIARKLYRTIPFKQPAYETLRRLVSLPEPVYRHLSFQGVIDVAAEETSFRMRHHGYQLENEVFWSGLFGRWEGASVRMWVQAARQAQVILDVGANTGLFALAAKAVAPQASVMAFEPVDRIRKRLSANVELNRFDLPISPAAVSDRDGTGFILDTEEEHEIAATMDETYAVLSDSPRKKVAVPVVRLDTLVSAGTIRPPDLIKIDVEGHETAVLRGMTSQLENKRPSLVIEVLTSGAADQIDRLTRPFGYLTYRLDQDGPRRLDAVEPVIGSNLFMCSPDTAERLIEKPGDTAAPTA